MRILHLHFKNLNSLEGDWKLDFTQPAFMRDGIFAITGPTGSGKTTILDAICLALYGTTPRLGKITKSKNEIMSRRTGECFAELVFETGAGRFRCHWSQRRARKKPGGELQNPQHEVSNADTGEILASGIRDVADLIEEKTGLNFDRFTRSMLLAQGGFAAFLQAGPDERSPILEEITGTEIYSRISIAVHGKLSNEKKELELLRREISGMNLLTQGDRARLEEELFLQSLEEKKAHDEIACLSACISWLEGIARLVSDLSQLGEEEEKLLAEKEAFIPSQALLRRANLALGLSPEFTGLRGLRQELDAETREAKKLEEGLPELKKALKEAGDVLEKAGTELLQNRATYEKALPAIRRARELDLQITEQEKPILKGEDEIAKSRKSLGLSKGEYEKSLKGLAEKKKAIKDLEALLLETAADDFLVGEFAGIREHVHHVQALAEERKAQAKSLESLEKKIGKQGKTLEEKGRLLEKSRSLMDAAEKESSDLKTKLEEKLGSEDLSFYRKKLDLLKEREKGLKDLMEALESLGKSRKTLSEILERKGKLKEEGEKSLLEISRTERELDLTLDKEKSLERERLLLQKIRSLEEERAHLVEGEACPLCGSLDHPFAREEGIPEHGEGELEEIRKRISSLRSQVTERKILHAETGKTLEHLEGEERDLQEKIVSLQVLVKEAVLEIPAEISDTVSLAPVLEENRKNLENMEAFLLSAEKLQKAFSELEKRAWEKKEAFLKEESLFLSAKNELEKALENKQHLCDADRNLLSRLGEAMKILERDFESLGEPVPSLENFGESLKSLSLRKKTREERSLAREKLAKEISSLETRVEKEKEAISGLENLLLKQNEENLLLKEERDALKRERFVLFGEKNPDEEEAILKASLGRSEEKRGKAEESRRAQEKNLGDCENRLSFLETAMEKRKILINEKEKTFSLNLEARGFSSEEDFLSALLGEEKMKTLSEKADFLEKASHSLDARKREKEALLLKEREKNLTDEEEALLAEKLSKAKEEERDLQQKKGAILSKLSEDATLRENRKSLVESLEAREREVSRWQLLDSLIGSHDGKKYRNFVQGLTLELVVGHANIHLQRITDRYVLVRDEKEPLDLQVRDTWQADETRTTKNLSGGESFLVSLALALGLSGISGSKVAMDSLFLDEGFGTLDEDALEVALSALSSLRSEGKLIGLISHVNELKERIPCRIELIPETGGRSRIK